MPDRPYVRIYYDDLIRDYQGVWEDDLQLAAFVRLLATADPMWPTPPELPRSLKQKALERLEATGLLILLGQRYRMKGLDAERNARAERGRPGAAVRWQSERNANALPTHTERNASRARSEPSRAETEPSRTRAENDPYDDPEGEALTWLAKHGCDVRPGNGYHQKLVVAVEQHGSNAVIGMFDRLARAGTKPGDIKGYLFGAIDALNARSRPNVSALEAEERESERQEAFTVRAARTRERNAELAKAIEEANR